MRIACLLDTDFEDSEFRKPYEAFTAAGHTVVVIGLQADAKLTGKQGREVTRSERGITGVAPDEFDALFLPGGYSPDHLRADQRMVDFVRAFFDRERPVFAVCHGPQLLITAGVVEGRTMTAWKTVQVDLRAAGAKVVDQPVVVDRYLVTSRQPDDLDAFAKACLALLDQVGAGAR
jgi:protease I